VISEVISLSNPSHQGNRVSEFEPVINPYAPSAVVENDPLPDPGSPAQEMDPPASLARTALRWLIVCGLSAMPSFFWGFAITNGRFAGMILGIMVFVVGYTLLDYRTASRPFRQRKTIRRTLRIAYGTRIAISILFPLGMYLDLICGMLSISVTQSVMGFEFSDSGPASFGASFVTTLVQGIVLNLVLGMYAAVVFTVQLLVVQLRR
jgi:hypothetical protein